MPSTSEFIVISPYFGKLPSNISYWIKSVSKNPDLDFLIVTDHLIDEEIPSNLKIVQLTFREFTDLVIDKLNLSNTFDPYKICDFKPAFGVIFSDYIKGYEYWGHCDLDLIFGDISYFLPKSNDYVKFLDLGHLSIYRNQQEINYAFKLPISNLKTWSYIKNSKIIWVYDELYWEQCGGINGIISENFPGKLISDKSIFSDIDPKYTFFSDINMKNQYECFFRWRDGNLFKFFFDGLQVQEVKVLYAHFQKRDVKFLEISESEFLIIPLTWKDITTFGEAKISLKKDRIKNIKFIRESINKEHILFLKRRKANKLKIFFKDLIMLRVNIRIIIRLVVNRILN